MTPSRRLGLIAAVIAPLGLLGCDADGEMPTGADTEGATSSDSGAGPSGGPDASGGRGDSGEDSDAGGSDTDGGASDTDDGGEPIVDLFACEPELSCEQVIWHVDPEPASATACIADLMATQTPGAASILETLGPFVLEDESLLIVRGDGTAIRQLRHRECEDCDGSTLPWELEEPQVCRVRVDVENYEGCQAGTYECLSAFALLDCEPLEGASCESVSAALDAEPPTLTACGEDACPFGTVCVQEPDACVCDPELGEYDYVPRTPTCRNAPQACEGPIDGWDVRCLGALCDSGGHEFDVLEGGLLTCGEDAGDCFGEC